MTYKHVKFDDSPVMRSLTKVAQAKGWIKEQPLVKTAAPKTNLTPTNSLLDNVLKLCAGLRDRGFEKQASELEINLLNYKQAQTLYETTPEKGEDLVHAAHPQGSHKLEGLDAENDGAVVEDILDQQAKSIQTIEKKPIGKSASILEAIEAVKVAIGAPPLVVKRIAKVVRGQEAPLSTNVFTEEGDESLVVLYQQAKNILAKFRQIYSNIAMQLGEDINSNNSYFNAIENILNKKDVYHTPDVSGYLADALTDLQNDSAPGFFASLEDKQKWQDVILPMLAIANKYTEPFRDTINKILKLETESKTQSVRQYDPDASTETKPTTQSESSLHPLFQQINNLQQKLKSWLAIRSIAQNEGAAKWVNDEIKALQDIVDRYANVSPDQQANMVGYMTQEINNETKDISTFEGQWITPQTQ